MQLDRSDIPALLFILGPVIGLIFDASPVWYLTAMTFWLILALRLGDYTISLRVNWRAMRDSFRIRRRGR